LCKRTHYVFNSDWPWELAFYRYFKTNDPIIKFSTNWRDEYTQRMTFWSELKRRWARSKFINHRSTFNYDTLSLSNNTYSVGEKNHFYLHQLENGAILQCSFHDHKLTQTTRLQAFSGIHKATCIASYMPPSIFSSLSVGTSKEKKSRNFSFSSCKDSAHLPNTIIQQPAFSCAIHENTNQEKESFQLEPYPFENDSSIISKEEEEDFEWVQEQKNFKLDNSKNLLKSNKFAFAAGPHIDLFVKRSFSPCKHPFRKLSIQLPSKHEKITHLTWVEDHPVLMYFCQASGYFGAVHLLEFQSPVLKVYSPQLHLQFATTSIRSILATLHAMVFVPSTSTSLKAYSISTEHSVELPPQAPLTDWIYSTWSHPYLYQYTMNANHIKVYDVMTLQSKPFIATVNRITLLQLYPKSNSESVLIYADQEGGIHLLHHPTHTSLGHFQTKEVSPIIALRLDPLSIFAINQLGFIYAFEPHGKGMHKWIHSKY
ncbi:hypothetical protein HMI54_011700, partial [Coelomomyces lativittatus]